MAASARVEEEEWRRYGVDPAGDDPAPLGGAAGAAAERCWRVERRRMGLRATCGRRIASRW